MEEGVAKPNSLPLVLMPIVFVGSILLPGRLQDLVLDTGLPFVFTVWIGMGFSFAWDSLRYSMHTEKFSPGMMAATGLLCAFIFLLMIGLESLWHDPWLFGVAIVPGFTFARPWIEKWLAARTTATGTKSP
jgi:hypothetical protein